MTCTTHHHGCECREERLAEVERERDEYRAAVDGVLAALWDATGDAQTYPLTALGERVRRAIQRPASEVPMTPAEIRRVALGAIVAALREQKAKLRAIREEHGRTSPQAKKAVARLDELREAHGALCGDQSGERTARMLLRGLVDEWREGAVTESSLRFAAEYLEETER